jgi:RimJ/RimL family protein N-acetyltransferase
MADPARELIIAEADGEAVATVRFDRDDASAEVSITLAPDARGRALAYPVLDAACRDYWTRHEDTRLLATIRPDNRASLRVFEHVGFRRTGELSPTGFAYYVAEPALSAGADAEDGLS